jgi:hypothetical protein
MLLKDTVVSNVYSFTTHSPVFLGAKIERARLISKCNVAMARKLSPIDQTYAQVFPGLPAGSVYNLANEIYYVFELLNGDQVVMAGQWIIEDSLEEIHHVSYTVSIPNGDNGTADKISMALRAVGITDFSISSY